MSSKFVKKPSQVTGLTVLVMKSQLFFADSLTSTLLDWLIYATCLSVLTRLHSHIQLMLEWVLSLYFLATSKRSSIKPETTIATVFTCNKRRKSACWTNSWQVSPKYFSKGMLVRISLISEKTVLMCNDFLLWSVVETRLILQDGLSWSSLRTWMVPCQGWSFQNLIASNRF